MVAAPGGNVLDLWGQAQRWQRGWCFWPRKKGRAQCGENQGWGKLPFSLNTVVFN
jgi:hypothetical protein